MLAVLAPERFFLAGAAALIVGVGVAGFLFPWTCFGLAVGSLILSPENFIQFEVGGVDLKSLHRVLVLAAFGATVLRHGVARPFNAPLLAVFTTFLTTLFLSDIHPHLSYFQIVKSLFGFVVLFLFINVNYSPSVVPLYLRMIGVLPILSVVGGILAQAAHLNSPWGPWEVLPTEWTGARRLNGLNISAILAYFAYVAIFANFCELLDSRKKWLLGLVAVNLAIIILTGTRTPTAAALMLVVFVLLFAGRRTLNLSAKLNIAIVSLFLIGAVLVLWWPTIEIRAIRSFGGDESYFSGRDIIWDYFLEAFWEDPWFGRGLGTGAILLIGKLTVTTAAHNEYLRLLTDVGIVGLTLFLAGIAWWVRAQLRFLERDERLLVMSFLLMLALYTFTDNTLSSPPSLMAMFALSLLFARGRHRHARARRPAASPAARQPNAPVIPSARPERLLPRRVDSGRIGRSAR